MHSLAQQPDQRENTIATAIDPQYLAVLDELKVDQIEHRHGSARAHLVRVHDFLLEWRNPQAVCLAGLFHNMYGTEMFKPQAAELSRRAEFAKRIGSEAEELAFLFCVSRRIGFFDEHSDPARPVLWDEVNKRRIVTTAGRLAALIEIEIANNMELYSPDLGLSAEHLSHLLQSAKWMAQSANGKVSAQAYSALEGMIASLRRDLEARLAMA
jgi:hypothetical protein